MYKSIKRINNEMQNLYSKYCTNENNININYCKTKIVLSIENKIFEIDDRYPFYPPKVFINQQIPKPYIYILQIKSPKINKIIKNYIKKKCLCCSTITSANNWSPSYHIEQILDEIKYVNEIKRVVKYHIAIENILIKNNISEIFLKVILEYLIL